MPPSFRFFASRTLVAVGTRARLVLIVVLLTGGFVIDAGPLHYSSRRPTTPLLIYEAMAAFSSNSA